MGKYDIVQKESYSKRNNDKNNELHKGEWFPVPNFITVIRVRIVQLLPHPFILLKIPFHFAYNFHTIKFTL